MRIRHLVLVLGDQLNLDNPALANFDKNCDHVLMVECADESSQVWSHKARIALFLSAMRHFAEKLKAQNFPLSYLQLAQHTHANLADAWLCQIALWQPQAILVCEPGDYRVLQDLRRCAELAKIPLSVCEDTHFMCSQAEFRLWAKSYKSLRMEFFYRYMRQRYQVLMQDHAPLGGSWNFDADNRESFGKSGPVHLPRSPEIEVDSITHQVLADVEYYFAEHPGSLRHFIWPVTREAALKFLADFIQQKLAGFGQHQDAMWQGDLMQTPYLWHSLLASSLNLKLLHPSEVIAAAEQAYQQHKLPLASVEGFIRQVLGWREFIRGVYWLEMPQLAKANHYQHEGSLPAWYWTANTHMNCLRQTIQQSLDYGYAHHIQRLMITGMFGLVAEIKPGELEAWYLAMYVDAVQWVELPNTIGMALYANAGKLTSKPYVASGAYIKRMSNYCSHCRYKPELKFGPQACPYTVFYWNFIMKHALSLGQNPRTTLMLKHLDKMSTAQKQAIQSSAQTMLQQLADL